MSHFVYVFPLWNENCPEGSSDIFICPTERVLWSSSATDAFRLPMEEHFWKSVIWHAEDVSKVSPSTFSYNSCDIWLACVGTDPAIVDTALPTDTKDSEKTVILKGGKAFLQFPR